MVKDETGSGWLNRASTLSRSIFRLQLNEKQKRWQPNGTSRSPLSWSDVHNWNYPEADFDVVVEIFTQFSSPAERALKWSGMKRSLKSGGLLIIQGYTPKQLEYGTGGPKQIENLYTRAILERAFAEFRLLSIVEEECEIYEGPSHGGMSAVINLTATKP